MPTVVPSLIDALVAQTRAAVPSTTTVYDGTGASDEPGDFLMIGVEDPDLSAGSLAAEVSQSWAHANYTGIDETGQITCTALSWNGDGNAKTARDAAYATVATVEALLRATPSLGLATLLWTKALASQRLTQQQGETGAVAWVDFTISFRARL